MIRVLSLLGVLVFLYSCTGIQYQTAGKVPVYVAKRADHTSKISYEGIQDFYLWGQVPNNYSINVDKKLQDFEKVSISKLTVEHYQTWNDIFVTAITFGMYVPIHYRIEAFGISPKKEARYDDNF